MLIKIINKIKYKIIPITKAADRMNITFNVQAPGEKASGEQAVD